MQHQPHFFVYFYFEGGGGGEESGKSFILHHHQYIIGCSHMVKGLPSSAAVESKALCGQ